MKIILRSLVLSVLFIYALLIFLPKENLYYLALEKLSDHKVEVVSSSIKDTNFGLNISNSKIKYEKIDVAAVDRIFFKTLLFKTELNIQNLKVQKSLKKFFPYDMKYIKITHNILDPLAVDIKLSKQFKIKNKDISKYLTKTENGYRYEYKFK